MNRLLALLLTAVLLHASGCAVMHNQLSPTSPNGAVRFRRYEAPAPKRAAPLPAEHATGVRLSVVEPRKAIENELTWRGHSLVENVPVTSQGGTAGRLMTFTGRREGQEFTYILGVFVKGGRILLTEAGGKADAFDKHKAEISQSLLSVR